MTTVTHPALRTLSISLAASAAMTLCGCGVLPRSGSLYKPTGMVAGSWNIPTPTSPMMAGGYSETRIADDQYLVYFKEADSTWGEKALAVAKDMARLRAAQITLNQGYTYFVISDEAVVGDAWAFPNGVVDYTVPRVNLKIRLLKSPDSSVSGALDAQSVVNDLGPKYDTFVAAQVQKYRKLAEQGKSYAQSYMGYLYANGWGVPQDYAQAAQWYRKAADQGEPVAQYNLGFYYENGRGVPQDKDQAVQWYRKAAAQGDPDAQQKVDALVFSK